MWLMSRGRLRGKVGGDNYWPKEKFIQNRHVGDDCCFSFFLGFDAGQVRLPPSNNLASYSLSGIAVEKVLRI